MAVFKLVLWGNRLPGLIKWLYLRIQKQLSPGLTPTGLCETNRVFSMS